MALCASVKNLGFSQSDFEREIYRSKFIYLIIRKIERKLTQPLIQEVDNVKRD